MVSTSNAETSNIALPEDITIIETSVGLELIFKKHLEFSVEHITSIATTSSGTKLFGIMSDGLQTFNVIDDKGNVIFRKKCQWGEISKNGEKIFLSTEPSNPKNYERVVQMDLKGNVLRQTEFPLGFHITGNDKYIAQFSTEEDWAPQFILSEIDTDRVIWKRDFPWKWEGYLLPNGNLIVILFNKDSNITTIYLYGLNGEELWQYNFPQGYKFPWIYIGNNTFLAEFYNDRSEKERIKHLFFFNEKKGLLWDKKLGLSQLCLSRNDRYIGVMELKIKELFLLDSSSGKEIYRIKVPQNLRYAGLDINEQGEIALQHTEGAVIVSSEGKIIAEFRDSEPKCRWVDENCLLIYTGNNIQMISIGK